MSDPTAGRPRQVTLAGWLIMVGSVVVVALVFNRLTALHTLETRQAIERFLAEPPGSDLGVGVDGVITTIRTLAMVTAGCATAAGILGYQVLRRSRSARLAVTVLAVPLFVAGLVTGGFASSVVAAAAAILWLQPARAWFTPGSTPEPSAASASGPSPAPPVPPVPPVAPAYRPVAAARQVPPPFAGSAAGSERRPWPVTVACLLTWVFTGLTVLGLLASAIALAVAPDLMLDEVHRENPDLADQGVSDQLVVAGTLVLIAGLVLWCVGSVVLAALTFRRIGWARIVLVVSAAIAAVMCLIGSAMGALLLALPLAASVVTAVLLLRPEARVWFARRHTP